MEWNKCHNTQTLFLDGKDAPSHETKPDDLVQNAKDLANQLLKN